jgi:hypothetical protein
MKKASDETLSDLQRQLIAEIQFGEEYSKVVVSLKFAFPLTLSSNFEFSI